jgi:hypothetical protein
MKRTKEKNTTTADTATHGFFGEDIVPIRTEHGTLPEREYGRGDALSLKQTNPGSISCRQGLGSVVCPPDPIQGALG